MWKWLLPLWLAMMGCSGRQLVAGGLAIGAGVGTGAWVGTFGEQGAARDDGMKQGALVGGAVGLGIYGLATMYPKSEVLRQAFLGSAIVGISAGTGAYVSATNGDDADKDRNQRSGALYGAAIGLGSYGLVALLSSRRTPEPPTVYGGGPIGDGDGDGGGGGGAANKNTGCQMEDPNGRVGTGGNAGGANGGCYPGP